MAITEIGIGTLSVAVGAGTLSFLSPCVLPLVPAYVSIITGLDVVELRTDARSRRLGIIRDTALFVGGFSVVFITLGLSATAAGSLIFRHQLLLTRVAGVFVMSMGLFLLVARLTGAQWMAREARPHPKLARYGRAAPLVAGAAFGLGWTPCIGPVLGSILGIAASTGRAPAAAALLTAYSVGLAIPFFAAGLALGRMTRLIGWFQRRSAALTTATGMALTFLGALLVLNRLVWVTSALQTAMRAVGLESLVNLG